MLPEKIEHFITDVRADLGGEIADKTAEAFEAIDVEADYNNHAGVFLEAVEWIVGHRDRTIAERIEMVGKLRHLKGYNVVNLREFTGWK
jgi:hypothetical protein